MKYLHSFFNWVAIGQNGTYLSREIPKNEILKQVMLPITPGCYVWIYDNKVIYIGRSNNIQNRLGAHIFSKITGPRSNAIFTTTARDTIIRLYSKVDIEIYRNLSKEEKSSNQDYLILLNKLNEILNKSSFIIYSTKDSLDSFNLERELIKDLKPITNNVIPNTTRKRDDFKVLGIKI
jgi:excinuclease UvrABC nuclease subunit